MAQVLGFLPLLWENEPSSRLLAWSTVALADRFLGSEPEDRPISLALCL